MEVLWLKTKAGLEIKVKLVWKRLHSGMRFGMPHDTQWSQYVDEYRGKEKSVQQWLLFTLQFLSLSDLVTYPYLHYIHSF